MEKVDIDMIYYDRSPPNKASLTQQPSAMFTWGSFLGYKGNAHDFMLLVQ